MIVKKTYLIFLLLLPVVSTGNNNLEQTSLEQTSLEQTSLEQISLDVSGDNIFDEIVESIRNTDGSPEQVAKFVFFIIKNKKTIQATFTPEDIQEIITLFKQQKPELVSINGIDIPAYENAGIYKNIGLFVSGLLLIPYWVNFGLDTDYKDYFIYYLLRDKISEVKYNFLNKCVPIIAIICFIKGYFSLVAIQTFQTKSKKRLQGLNSMYKLFIRHFGQNLNK